MRPATRSSLLLVALVAAAAPAAQPDPVGVPRGAVVEVDGRLDDAAWEAARVVELAGGGEALLLHDDGDWLQVGIRGGVDGWAHVYVVREEEVRVLHASAALGTARYRRDAAGAWQPAREFEWTLRDRELDDEALERRAAFVAREGWIASVQGMGVPGEIEYRISRELLGPERRVALLFAAAADAPRHWPARLEDATLARELIFGNSPSDLHFDPRSWAVLELVAGR